MTEVHAPGASCRLGPSPTADAIRLDSLRTRDAASLAALLGRLPPAPWDAAAEAGSPLAAWLEAEGFVPYGRTVTVSRTADGLPRAPLVPGAVVGPYRNAEADHFIAAEAAAMTGTGCFAEMGSPTGYEHAEGHGAFVVARDGNGIVGFCHAQVPEGLITWLGVVPDWRRRGLAHALVAAVAREVTAARGTHLLAESADRAEALAFFRALGFRERTRRVLLLRRG
ncbi:MAG: GNAT family N-acetyltransferase [Thermoleophilia bacterium]|nr:GNAT family N-acetyltransferase [Thermoleophilia bacterium]